MFESNEAFENDSFLSSDRTGGQICLDHLSNFVRSKVGR